jgi:hypothetical protein
MAPIRGTRNGKAVDKPTVKKACGAVSTKKDVGKKVTSGKQKARDSKNVMENKKRRDPDEIKKNETEPTDLNIGVESSEDEEEEIGSETPTPEKEDMKGHDENESEKQEKEVENTVCVEEKKKEEAGAIAVSKLTRKMEYEIVGGHVTILKNRLKKETFSLIKFANELDLTELANDIGESDLKIKKNRLPGFSKSIIRHIKIQTSHLRCAVTRSFKKNLTSK